MDVQDKIIKNHKSKSIQVKELKLKLKKTISLGKLEAMLAAEKNYKLDGWNYQGLDEYDHKGYDRDHAAKEAKIELLEDLIRQIK